MRVMKTEVINVSADAAWQVVGEGFADIYKWLDEVLESSLEGDLDKGATRTCILPKNQKLTERMNHFDRKNRVFRYNVIAGVPSFMKVMEFRWKIEEVDENHCRATGEVIVDLAWYAWPMTPLLKAKLGGAVGSTIPQLAAEASKVSKSDK